jgi:hypothetical protein
VEVKVWGYLRLGFSGFLIAAEHEEEVVQTITV